MKQIAKTPQIIERLKRAAGVTVNLENLAVYEAIALNSRPLRKRHPLYNGAVAERSMLLEMAARLEDESVPLQIQHQGDALPIGRVFFGEVVDNGAETELRALFWVDKSAAADKVNLIDNGTVDQVSVGVLPKRMVCSADGFDFFGATATMEHIYTGTTPDGHKLGKDGVHARMQGLDQFFEMSLVGQGGAQNARIVNSDQSHFNTQNLQRLAASGADLDHLALTATAELDAPKMDMKDLIAQLTTTSGELAVKGAENVTLAASVTALTAERDALQAQVETLESGAPALTAANERVTTLEGEIETQKANLSAADTALRGVLTKVLTAAGKQDEALPEALSDVIAKIDETSAALAASLSSGGKAAGAEGGASKKTEFGTSAFRARARR